MAAKKGHRSRGHSCWANTSLAIRSVRVSHTTNAYMQVNTHAYIFIYTSIHTCKSEKKPKKVFTR